MTTKRIVATLCLAALLLALVSPLGIPAWVVPPPGDVLGASPCVEALAAEPEPALFSPHLPDATGRGPPARA